MIVLRDVLRVLSPAVLTAVVPLFAPCAQAAQETPPGRRIDNAAAVSEETLATRCIGPPPADWPGWTAAEIALQRARSPRVARCRRKVVRGAGRSTATSFVALQTAADTARVEQLVLLFGEERGDRYVPVWHDHGDAEDGELLRPPRVGPLDDGLLMAHRRCLRGTGGCTDWPFRLRADGSIEALRRAYLDELRARLPEEWGFWKGVHIEPEASTVEAPVYVRGDANRCPAFLAGATLRVSGSAVHLDSLAVLPDTGSGAWTVDPVRGAGQIRPNSSLESLVRAYGAAVVRPISVEIGEGMCIAGARVFPDSLVEVEVGWVDSAGGRPAFVRIARATGPWRTASGVRAGTPLARLEEIHGGPVVFSGFGWDYGGTLSWTEDGGVLRLRLAPDPAALRAARSEPRGDELFGERDVASDHPLVPGLGITVGTIMIEWAQPVPDQIRFCG